MGKITTTVLKPPGFETASKGCSYYTQKFFAESTEPCSKTLWFFHRLL
jgi:hypothetical protein